MKTIHIPIDKIDQGIKLCLTNVKLYINDSRRLMEAGSVEHVVVLVIFAAEELAKASILSKRLYEQKGRDAIEVETKLFRGRGAHEFKMKEAKQLLGDSLILESSRVGYAELPFTLGEEVVASPELRLQCAFVDFEDGKWKFGTSYSRANLEDLLRKIEDEVSRLSTP